MTEVTFFKNREGEFLGFECLGHAGYANAGEDIVCAGISALVINTVNAIEQYTGQPHTTEADEESGAIRLRLVSPVGHDADLLMKSLVLGLRGIGDYYGNRFIQVRFEEV